MTDHFRKQGRSLLANGYLIVPIRAGRKSPAMSEWQRARLGAEDLSKFPNHGVGVITGQGAHPICALDIDCLNPTLSRRFQQWCIQTIGPTAVRQGLAPKVLLVYRAEQAGWGKASSAIFDDMFDGKCQLEILGDGQQFVAYHVHPDTNEPYEWLDDRGGIENISATDLPVIHEEQVYDAIRMFEQMAIEEGLLRRSSGCGTLVPEKRERTAPDDDDYFGRVNAAAMERLDAWVPALFPSARQHDGGYRVSPVDLGRDTEEDLAIHPKGIKDFGLYDMGDERQGRRTPLDVVMEWGAHADISFGTISAMEAAQWLCDMLSTTPEAMGWGLRRKRERQAGMEAKRKALQGVREAIQGAEDSVTLREEVGPQLRTVLELHQDLYSEIAGLFNQHYKKVSGVSLPATDLRRVLSPIQTFRPTAQRTHPLTEFGNAERLIDLHGKSLMYVPEMEQWFSWQENHWEKATPVFLEHLAKQMIYSMGSEADRHGDDAGALYQWAKASQSRSIMSATIHIARSDQRVVVPADELDKHRHLLGVKNGVVDLRTGELLPANPEYRITKTTLASYNPNASSYWFMRTLREAMWDDEEMVQFILSIFGYAMMADPKHELLFIPWGDGANGKGAIFESGFQNMMGEYARTVSSATFVESGKGGSSNGGAPREDLVRLRGARYAFIGETEQDGRLREADVKSMSGGDKIVARKPHGTESIEFYPSWVAVMPTNHKPTVRSDDHGIWRRLVPIHFSRKFDSDPQLEKDELRKEKIKSEADGILQLAIQAAIRYQREGIKLPKKVLADRADYRESMDVLSAWMDQCCEIGGQFEDTMMNLWQSWHQYAEATKNINYISNAQSLSRRLDNRFKTKKKSGGIRWKEGIRVKTDFLAQNS